MKWGSRGRKRCDNVIIMGLFFFFIISGHNCIISGQFPPSRKAAGGEGAPTALHRSCFDYFFHAFALNINLIT